MSLTPARFAAVSRRELCPTQHLERANDVVGTRLHEPADARLYERTDVTEPLADSRRVHRMFYRRVCRAGTREGDA